MLRVPFKMLLAPVPPIRLACDNAALLLIDPLQFTTARSGGLGQAAEVRGISREFDDYFSQAEAAIRNMARLAAACREHGLPVIYSVLNSQRPDRSDTSRQMQVSRMPVPVGPPEAGIRPEVAPALGEAVLPRGTYSPFAAGGLQDRLRALGVDSLIVAGVLANLSVAMAAREAADRDFSVVVATDACAGETLEWHLQTMTGLVGGLIRVRSTREIIEMLEGTRT
jgi:nicotinamidase-related amidase